jgi:nucleoside-diphosphate-sugar epimerase
MFLPRLVRSVLDGRPVVLRGTDGLRCNPVHVSDAVRGLLGSCRLEQSDCFDVAGPEVRSLRQIAVMIGTELGRAPQLEVVDGAQPDLIGRVGRMSALFGAPRVSLAEGLAELCGHHGRMEGEPPSP